MKDADFALNSSRYRIKNAAEALFARKGYGGVTVKEISDAASVNIAAISYYFGGKESLYTFILRMHAKNLEEALQTIQETDAASLEKIHLFAERILSIRQDNPNFNGILSFALISQECGEIVEEVVGKIKDFLEECLTEAIGAGECNLVVRPHLIDILTHNTLSNFSMCEPYNFFSEVDIFSLTDM
ncbi:TetR/AcrR family transcriptional regulator [Azotosporobacter soli]|uniref:TetR/AcrR family transcriptional regulator n=1 Tax=Azotosporobacter soli TaxID=3055040 RepID=UPI0031FEF3B3